MSARNGDRARFQKERKRKLLRRQRLKALTAATKAPVATGHRGNRRRQPATTVGTETRPH